MILGELFKFKFIRKLVLVVASKSFCAIFSEIRLDVFFFPRLASENSSRCTSGRNSSSSSSEYFSMYFPESPLEFSPGTRWEIILSRRFGSFSENCWRSFSGNNQDEFFNEFLRNFFKVIHSVVVSEMCNFFLEFLWTLFFRKLHPTSIAEVLPEVH